MNPENEKLVRRWHEEA